MRYLQFNMAIVFALALMFASCSDKDDSSPRIIPTMTLTVSEIADNRALITAEQKTGTTVGAKVIDFYPVADMGFDYNVEVKLVKFVEENGVPVSLPYVHRIEEGLKPGVNYISAIIAYNAEGRAVCSAFQTWKASGTEGMWSDDNSAGELEENEW
nr:hypothetical protein [uncultured Bacteroides sp.]